MVTRYALITGTSTGIGRAAAIRLARAGIHVFAGVRRQGDGESVVAEFARLAAPAGAITPILLDVANDDSIHSAVAHITRVVRTDGLWALVNNAGIVVPGPIEYLTRDDWRRQFDVNFFGLIELTRAAIPLLRLGVTAMGVGAPRILIVSSIGGRVAQPMISPYATSKFAVTAFGDSLRLELRRRGIGVTVLEPGAVATAIWGKGGQQASRVDPNHPLRIHYGAEIDALATVAKRSAAAAIPADDAADILYRALIAPVAPARVLVGRDAKIAAFFKQWLPMPWFDGLIMKAMGLGKLPLDVAPM